MRPCNCNRCPKPGTWQSGQCRLCWLYHNDPRYRTLWEGSTTPLPSRQETNAGEPCCHRGTVLEEQQCRSCRGNVSLKIFACALHGRCTVGKPLPDCACCATCQDYQTQATEQHSLPLAKGLASGT